MDDQSQNEENILDLLDNRTLTTRFTKDYKDKVFYTWYEHGRPSAATLRGLIESDVNRKLPNAVTLRDWTLSEEFQVRADELDRTVKAVKDNEVITEKIEMLKRHADTGKEMQEVAVRYLREHEDELRPNTALRMLVEGIRIERESRGLPTLLTKVIQETDEELVDSINKLLSSVETSEDESNFAEELPE